MVDPSRDLFITTSRFLVYFPQEGVTNDQFVHPEPRVRFRRARMPLETSFEKWARLWSFLVRVAKVTVLQLGFTGYYMPVL
jgi:hypothetical protein